MDFFKIKERSAKNDVTEVYPDFQIVRSKDLMIRGRSFYAIWDEGEGLWSTDEYDVQRLVDQEIWDYVNELKTRTHDRVRPLLLGDFSTNSWLRFRNYIGHLSDSSHELDTHITFANTETKKTDYISRRLSYPLQEGDHSAWDELVSTLYSPSEREKIEWAIGAIVSGDSKTIQKFLVFYGGPGTGKSTIMNIIAKLFESYVKTFEAQAMTSNNNAFALEVFKTNPMVAINHDADLSKITDNTILNSAVSHEIMTMNEKFKPSYDIIINAFLFIGSNKPVKITDAKSGLIRRLIDVQPTNNLLSPRKYQSLYSRIDFELGAIAHHCLEVYRSLGKDYYSGYRPVEMMLQTDIFFNFIESSYDVFRDQNGVTLAQAHAMYKEWADESDLEFKMPRHKLREELKNYFTTFEERAVVDDVRLRSYYSGFEADRFKVQVKKDEQVYALVMDDTESLLDRELAGMPAQYSKNDGTPRTYWAQVTTKLGELDTSKEHYVKVPDNHIVIDFDLKDANGEKSAERNLEAASKWPSTYAEFSKSGNGIHLHYNYVGDVSELSALYDDGIEVKVYVGDSSLRRRLSKCNNVPIADISSGLPVKEKNVKNDKVMKSEKALRDLIGRAMRKEIHAATKPSMDFIHKVMAEAYEQSAVDGFRYDVSDLRPALMAFANSSSNNALYCLKLIQTMSWKSDDPVDLGKEIVMDPATDERPVFFDVEVFPNLFVICWKYKDSPTTVRMVNPQPHEVEQLLSLMLVGFNCRRYDNHILYAAALLGYGNKELYDLSQRIISGQPNALFGEAYNISYADIYDFSSIKQSLKKFEIDLGIPHKELGLPWDKPVADDMIDRVVEYCVNDVMATEATFNDRLQDFVARQILADLSGLSINDSTQRHTARIVFGNDINPQEKFVYTDLSEMFPGYTYEYGKSTYLGVVTGEGGLVYSEPGMYENVALLDIQSMHPTSIEALNAFGEYTQNYSSLKAARIAIKHGDYEAAKGMLGGKLARHLTDPDSAEALSYALKIVINIVYGLTSARFPNPFKDPRNIDNIVAKRGALFMLELKKAVQEKGFTVAHIKTDSIKIPNATPEIIQFVMDFGLKYGYTFEHEATYQKMCLVNDAVYIAKGESKKKGVYWEAVGAQFQQPYVYKTLFSKEPITFRDKCLPKFVTTALYLDFDGVDTPMVLDDNKMMFVGKAGLFCPIQEGKGGGLLVREKEGKFSAATGAKGYFWLESDMVKEYSKEKDIDLDYFRKLVDEAKDAISKYGDVEWFMS